MAASIQNHTKSPCTIVGGVEFGNVERHIVLREGEG